MLADRLAKAWDLHRAGMPTSANMHFTDQGLVLGAGTVLAKAGASARAVAIDPADSRLQALLAAAHLRRAGPEALAHLAKAADCRRDGEDALADMHLALSGVSRLARPAQDAHRLFLADGLIRGGLDPDAVAVAALTGPFELLGKYDPDQPRVPSGGPGGGQWTADGGDASAASAGASQSPRQRRGATIAPHSQVNPQTVTPAAGLTTRFPYVGDDACMVANRDCYAHAFLDDPDFLEAPNHNENYAPVTMERLRDCQRTAFNCQKGRIALQESPRRGRLAARFPDGGIVIQDTGETPVYYPAPVWGGRPLRPHPFRRSNSDAPVAWTPPQGGGISAPPSHYSDDYDFPPFTAEADETPAAAGASFQDCEQVLARFAADADGAISDRQYSMSARWGRLLRGRVTVASADDNYAMLVVCWTGPAPTPADGPSIAFRIDAPDW